ncbi:hypothetical protein [Chitinolyticbacter albus]|uniref:hypothetical protein n=1 Tax=Chitinolyticbacter albus TaxID=2961951 RepID=UPI00210EB238|nr:hypothetical protein [Chitinolyticbacter albus]
MAKFVWKKWVWICTWSVLAVLGLFYWINYFNPLPSDEEMIENFQANRADFVEIVRRYRTYPRQLNKDSSFWFKDGDTLELYRRAGIDSVDYEGSTPWLPNPYSVETAIKKQKIVATMVGFELLHKYGALRIQAATTPLIDHPNRTDQRRHYRNTLRFGVIWKQYIFFPEVPRIESGVLFGPLSIVGKGFSGEHQFHEKEGVATSQYKARVLPSLNRIPESWKDFECVYRRIEPQWFIRMCNGH